MIKKIIILVIVLLFSAFCVYAEDFKDGEELEGDSEEINEYIDSELEVPEEDDPEVTDAYSIKNRKLIEDKYKDLVKKYELLREEFTLLKGITEEKASKVKSEASKQPEFKNEDLKDYVLIDFHYKKKKGKIIYQTVTLLKNDGSILVKLISLKGKNEFRADIYLEKSQIDNEMKWYQVKNGKFFKDVYTISIIRNK